MGSFYFDDRGELFCEEISISEIVQRVESGVVRPSNLVGDPLIQNGDRPHLGKDLSQVLAGGKSIRLDDVPMTPMYVYSLEELRRNVGSYTEAFAANNLKGILGYAAKANGNIEIVRALKGFGVEFLVTVSGFEVLAGLEANFEPKDIILNGNGKQDWEIKLAVKLGVFLNVDSEFDAKRLVSIASTYYPDKEVKVLLRIRPTPLDCTVQVHPYVNTSGSSKFGFEKLKLSAILNILRGHPQIHVFGIQCHLGSCIYDPNIYAFISELLLDVTRQLHEEGIIIRIVDLGGGFAIDYHRQLRGTQGLGIPQGEEGEETIHPEVPTIGDFMATIGQFIPAGTQVMFEPGRSLVASAGIIVSKTLGKKQVAGKNFAVVDASMNELIRPCLYDAHHQIYPAKITIGGMWESYDVVGPVCETSDFLCKNAPLQTPLSEYIAIMDTGAYGSTMSSNYNMRPRPLEVLVDGKEIRLIRERDSFQDLMTPQIYEQI